MFRGGIHLFNNDYWVFPVFQCRWCNTRFCCLTSAQCVLVVMLYYRLLFYNFLSIRLNWIVFACAGGILWRSRLPAWMSSMQKGYSPHPEIFALSIEYGSTFGTLTLSLCFVSLTNHHHRGFGLTKLSTMTEKKPIVEATEDGICFLATIRTWEKHSEN